MTIEAAYMAGVADSDGSFTISKRKSASTIRGYTYSVSFQLTWKECTLSWNTLMAMQTKYGGSIHKMKKTNSQYKKTSTFLKYDVYGEELKNLISDIVPYLKLKQDQAKLVQTLEENKQKWRFNHKGMGRSKPPKLWDFEDSLYEQMCTIKGHKRRDFSLETRR